jgi:hypothetical protein
LKLLSKVLGKKMLMKGNKRLIEKMSVKIISKKLIE